MLLDAGQAPWVVLLDAGQLRASGFLRRRINRPARMRMQMPILKKQKNHKAPGLWHEYEKDDDGTTKLLFHPSTKDQEETALVGISKCIGDNGTCDVTQPSSDVANLELGDFDRNREHVPIGIRVPRDPEGRITRTHRGLKRPVSTRGVAGSGPGK